MPTVTFIVDDTELTVEARDGQTLMRVAVENDVRGIEGECGGEMTCGTCHVWLCGPTAAAVPEKTFDEEDMLEVVPNRTPQSRLGCQVRLSAELDGLTAQVPGV